MTNLEVLLENKIAVDWTTLYVGWQTNRVLSEEITRFAMDQIGYSAEADEEVVAELAFADDRDNWTLRRCLDQLVSKDPATLLHTSRAWRWQAMKDYVDRLSARSFVQTEDAWDEPCMSVYDLEDIWRTYPDLLLSEAPGDFLDCPIEKSGAEGVRELVDKVNGWLERERKEIS